MTDIVCCKCLKRLAITEGRHEKVGAVGGVKVLDNQNDFECVYCFDCFEQTRTK